MPDPAVVNASPLILLAIDDLIEKMLAAKRWITRYLMEEYWLDIGRVEDYSEAEEAYRVHFNK